MKIAIICQSLLLEKALKLFLQPYIVPLKYCDFVLTDHKIEADVPQFQIKGPESRVAFPFSKSALLLSLEKFYKTINPFAISPQKERPSQQRPDFTVLEEKLRDICTKYNAQIVRAIKEHYGE